MRKKTRISGLGIACLVLILSGFEDSTATAQGPKILASVFDPSGPPIWVSARAAATEDDDLDRELFQARDRSQLLATANAFAQGCQIVFTGPSCTGPLPTSFDDLVQKAKVIVAGTISTIDEGFFDGIPASLLTLGNVDIHRSSSKFSLGKVFVRYPYAEIRIGNRLYCTADPRYAYRPTVGDKVLVFQWYRPRNLAGNLLEPFEYGIFVEDATHRLVVPAFLDAEPTFADVTSLDDVESLLIERLP